MQPAIDTAPEPDPEPDPKVEHPGKPVDIADENAEPDPLDEELLVEEISIDGMCGVY